jgi:Flp pilus assembly protein TadG
VTFAQALLRRRLQPQRRRDEGDRGSVSIEMVVLTPVLLLLMFTAIQAALWGYARDIAIGAAQNAARAGSAFGSDPSAACAAAVRFATQNGDGLSDVTCTPELIDGGRQLRITVGGVSLSLVPGVKGFNAAQSASSPIEQFTG